MTHPKKLIEVALPLEAISAASAREKSIRHGHPSTLHLWWARRPLAAARAVVFASLVDDPDDPQALPAFVKACQNLPKPPSFAPHQVASPRDRLLYFVERLVRWESTSDEQLLRTARQLLHIATQGSPPPLLDPFAGGGSIPLEAQRLGLEAHASDLNPVAVMINKAQIEIPPRFANQPPVNPRDREKMFENNGGRGMMHHAPTGKPNSLWRGAAGLAADVRYYGQWMREKAWERIGHLYPQYTPHPQSLPRKEGGTSSSLPSELELGEGPKMGEGVRAETVIAWLWARTVKSPNPAVNAPVPLVRSFVLSKKKGRECWAKPIVEPIASLPSELELGEGPGMGGKGMIYHAPTGTPTHIIRFQVTPGLPPKGHDGTMVNRRGATCIVSGEPIPFEYIRAEGKAGRMGAMLMAIVTEGQNGRNYHSPDEWHARVAASAQPEWIPAGDIPERALSFSVQLYGMDEYNKLFTPRQLVALTTFSDLVAEARQQAYADALAAGLPDDDVPLRAGGRGARAYAEAVSVYLAFAVDRGADYWSGICSWHSPGEKMRNTFGRQAIPMIWDYAEANPFSDSTGNWAAHVEWIWKVVENLPASAPGCAVQLDAGQLNGDTVTLSTDPPYYDNIGYADLSDFFYVWLRRTLRDVYPDEFGTLLVPKEAELIASPHRHGGKEAAKAHFEEGMRRAFANIRRFASPDYPMTVYYAFKQQEADDEASDEDVDDVDNGAHDDGGAQYVAPQQSPPSPSAPPQRASSGWETMLSSLIESGFAIVGTWPVRTELSNRMVGMGTNALASSIVLVCRPRPEDAPSLSRRGFIEALRRELPAALRAMQSGNIAPVDLAQASIGPGMAIYSRHRRVLEADGTPMSVRTALALINAALDAYLAEQDGDIDADTRFAVAWFEQFGFDEGEFGQADVLARAKNTSVARLEEAGLAAAGRGRVRLIRWTEYDPGAWDGQSDRRPTIWEVAHRLIERLHHQGETGAAGLVVRLPSEAVDEARQLAYRLYSLCERKGWASHARDYNALVMSWSGIGEEAARLRRAQASGDATTQGRLFDDEAGS